MCMWKEGHNIKTFNNNIENSAAFTNNAPVGNQTCFGEACPASTTSALSAKCGSMHAREPRALAVKKSARKTREVSEQPIVHPGRTW